jgi:hypothetical protein
MRFVVASRPPVAAACVRAFLEAALPRDTLGHVRAGGSRCGFGGAWPDAVAVAVTGQPPISTAEQQVCVATQHAIALRLHALAMQFCQRQQEYLHRQQPQIFGYDVFGFDPWMNQLKRTCRRVQRWTWMIHGDAAL